MTHDDVRELTPQYLLDELDADTRAQVVDHLRTCEACRNELRDIAVTFDALGRAVPQTAPSSDLRERVMTIAVPPDRRTLVDRRRQPARWLPWLVATAASVTTVISLLQVRSTRLEVVRLREEVAALRQATGAADAVRASLERRLADTERFAAVLRASDLVRFELAGQAPASAARGRAFVSRQAGVYFIAEGLPPLPSDKTYQLWVIVGGKPVSAGIFGTDPSGRAEIVLTPPPNLGQPAVVAVTPEPAGGLPAPSGPMYLVGKPSP